MAEQPIGRIEYLNRDGTVSSSWEFTKAKELEAVAWRNYDYDISSRIVAYRNQEGKTIPLDFLNDIEPPTPLCILDYAQWQKDTYKPPLLPEPVGCIDYLGIDGKCYNTVTYIDPQLFEKGHSRMCLVWYAYICPCPPRSGFPHHPPGLHPVAGSARQGEDCGLCAMAQGRISGASRETSELRRYVQIYPV